MESVLSEVRSRVNPSDEERERLNEVAEHLESRVQDAAENLGFNIDTIRTGSTARGTWVSGDRDIDLFVLFDTDLTEDELEERGITLGEEVLPDGSNDFASHPYRVGEVDGFDIDLVPCFDVDSASNIMSAVDRTPFHTRYLQPRMDEELASDVRVAKMFLKGIGAYGSDVRTQGFSGYLTELLVLEAGGFRELLEQSQNWNLPVRFDPEQHGRRTFNDQLVMVDPTDPDRNVAANLSEENLLRFQLNARRFLEEPSVEYFERENQTDMQMVRERQRQRRTIPFVVTFERPDVVDDTLFPQMRRTRRSLVETLDDLGFEVIRSADMANDEHAVMFLEMENVSVRNVQRVNGPPVGIEDGVDDFIEQYEDNENIVGPFIEGNRLVVERPREFTHLLDFMRDEAMFNRVAMRDAVESGLRLDDRQFMLYSTAMDFLKSEGFGEELTEFYNPSL